MKAKQWILVLVVASTCAVFTNGCSVYMASQHKGVSLDEVSQCRTRSAVIAKNGVEIVDTNKDADGNIVYEDYLIRKKTGSASRAVIHGALDVATIGIWEVVGTPMEGYYNKDTHIPVRIHYDTNQNKTKLEILPSGLSASTAVSPALPVSPVSPDTDHGSWRTSGTGFSIGPRAIVTANHVVAGMSEIEVRFRDGEWTSVRVTKASASTDIALLSTDSARSAYLEVVQNPGTLQGERVFTMGFPLVGILGKEPKYTDGVVSSLSGIQDDDCLLQVTVPVQPGNSGGPLVREDGTLVGIVTSTAAVRAFLEVTGTLPQSVTWAVKSAYIAALSQSAAEDGRNFEDRRALLAHVRDSVCQIRAK